MADGDKSGSRVILHKQQVPVGIKVRHHSSYRHPLMAICFIRAQAFQLGEAHDITIQRCGSCERTIFALPQRPDQSVVKTPARPEAGYIPSRVLKDLANIQRHRQVSVGHAKTSFAFSNFAADVNQRPGGDLLQPGQSSDWQRKRIRWTGLENIDVLRGRAEELGTAKLPTAVHVGGVYTRDAYP